MPTGTDFQVRFVGTNIMASGTFRIYLDNISFTQTATTVPNCDAILINPLNAAINVPLNVNLSWSSASGLADNYNLSVGTASGGTDIVNNIALGNVTSHTLTGLNYATDYFVNIVPSNSFGSAINCTEESFTTRNAPIVGTSCNNPILIDASNLDFTTTAVSTTDYENFYSSTPCGGNFTISGNEVVYAISPTQDVSINVELTNINNRATVHIVDDCPDVATTCLGFGDSTFSSNDVVINDVVFLSGNTYYIVVASTSSFSQTTFDLAVIENSCIVPTATYTPIEDCANGQFTVNIDVTYMGSATSLTIADDYGSTDETATATGIVSFGPYPSGTTVNYTVTNNQDNTCQITEETFFYCTPSNDECSDAIALTVNSDDSCSMTTSATNVSATESTTDDTSASCSGNNFNDVWFSFTATASSHYIEYLNTTAVIGTSTSLKSEVLEGTCNGGLTFVDCFSLNVHTMYGLTIGNTYYLTDVTHKIIKFRL